MGDEEFERFEYLIRAMDDAWMKHYSPKKSGSKE